MKALNTIFSVAMLVAMTLFTACDDKETNVTPNPDAEATISLKATTVEASADGGDYTINYTILDPVEGGKISATTTEKWLGKFSTDVEGVISFTVAPNNSATERTATVEVAYSAAQKTEKFTVKQAGSTEQPLKLTLSKAEETALTVHVKPLDREANYVVRAYTAEYIYIFGLTDDATLFQHDLDAMKSEAGMQGLHNYINKIASIGEADHTLSGLLPDTDYIVYCYHVDTSTAYPTLVGSIERLEARTAKPEVTEEVSFEVTYTTDSESITETIKPKNWDGYYYYGCWSVSDFKRYYGESADMQDTFIKAWYDTLKIQQTAFGKSKEQAVKELCKSGEQTIKHSELLAQTEYVLFVFGVDDTTGFAVSECLLTYVTTEKPAGVDMTIDIRVENLLSTTADVYWTASTDDKEFARSVFTREQWDAAGTTEEERMQTFCTEYSLFTARGETDMNLSNLTPDTEYIAFAFGIEGGQPITELFSISFRTLAKVEGKSKLTMTFDDYYLLSDLAAYDPTNWGSYADNSNTVLLPVDIKVEPYAYDIYYAAMPLVHDYYTDDQWITLLQQYQQYDRNHYNFFLTVGTTYTLMGVAKDSDGNWGALYKYELTPEASKCGAAESLVYESNN